MSPWQVLAIPYLKQSVDLRRMDFAIKNAGKGRVHVVSNVALHLVQILEAPPEPIMLLELLLSMTRHFPPGVLNFTPDLVDEGSQG